MCVNIDGGTNILIFMRHSTINIFNALKIVVVEKKKKKKLKR